MMKTNPSRLRTRDARILALVPALVLALVLATVLATAGCFTLPEIESSANPDEHVVVHPDGTCKLCDVYYRASKQIVRIIPKTGAGAGIVVTRSGAILTNAHVVGTADRLAVAACNDQRFLVKLLHRDPALDLALLHVEAGTIDVDPMPLIDRALPSVGTGVYVIGHSIGLGWTVTRGSVTAHPKTDGAESVTLLQTDAPLSPGNTGGPLLDEDGRLLGLVTSRAMAPGAEGVAFAIPVGVLKGYLDQRSRQRSASPEP